MIQVLMSVLGLSLIAAIVLMILERTKRNDLAKMVYMTVILAFFCITLSLLAQLLGEVNTVFHVW